MKLTEEEVKVIERAIVDIGMDIQTYACHALTPDMLKTMTPDGRFVPGKLARKYAKFYDKNASYTWFDDDYDSRVPYSKTEKIRKNKRIMLLALFLEVCG